MNQPGPLEQTRDRLLRRIHESVDQIAHSRAVAEQGRRRLSEARDSQAERDPRRDAR